MGGMAARARPYEIQILLRRAVRRRLALLHATAGSVCRRGSHRRTATARSSRVPIMRPARPAGQQRSVGGRACPAQAQCATARRLDRLFVGIQYGSLPSCVCCVRLSLLPCVSNAHPEGKKLVVLLCSTMLLCCRISIREHNQPVTGHESNGK